MNTKKDIAKPLHKSPLRRVEELHPYKMILILAMVGSSMIFLFTVIAYLATGMKFIASEFSIPKPFIIGSILLLFSSFTIVPCNESYDNENCERLVKSLWVTWVLGILFLICQVFGWKEMFEAGEKLGENRSATYLYILSGLHGLHFFGGMIALSWLTKQWLVRKKDPIKRLIAETNPFEKLKLHLMSIYWHFLDISWMLLFLFFLFFVY